MSKNSMKTEIKVVNPAKMAGRVNKLMSNLASRQAIEKKSAPKTQTQK